MKKVAKKSVKKYGVGGTNSTPKKDSMPVPSKQVRSGEGRGPRKYVMGLGSQTEITSDQYDRMKTAGNTYRATRMENLKNSMQKQKKGGSVKRKK